MMRVLLIGLLAAIGVTGTAQAKVQSYDFTAVLETVGSVRDLTWSDAGEGPVSGYMVYKGDIIKGSVSFDDGLSAAAWGSDPLSGDDGFYYYPSGPVQRVFLSYTFERTGQSYTAQAGSLSVDNNDYWNGDVFRVRTDVGDYWSSSAQSAELSFFNSDGTLFKNGTLPTSVSLADFDRAGFSADWNRSSDGGTIFARAAVTSWTPASPVPEPASAALMFAGLAMVGAGVAVRRSRRASGSV